ncbi:MAG: hypothetical protein DWQ44_05100 [Bacteroidetes bacterium]|nr:MAG: hypothetical protein DWQ33_11745 [Bacteroidota bacterium]REK00753.1 MAG: hypothetical protein DWQ39_11420 [Bacteroidota bacterium]REK35001.1 MAG: hypothetical protein DWQ44_05100 [Bacteroidota bacterium]REK48201.1 MAG: hypothetical protein DWQ48_10245 [Bacteroidota bacterium]
MIKKLIYALSLLFLSNVLKGQSLEDARKLTENEQYDAASALFRSLISKEPGNATIYYYYGENLLLSDNPDSAALIFNKGAEIDAANSLIKIGQAKILLDMISLAEAKSAADKDQGNAELQKRHEEARRNVEQANSIIDGVIASASQKNPLAYIESADAYIHFKNKDLDKARKLLDKALGIDPKNVEANLLYGDVYTELNNGTLAAEFYNKALDLNRNSVRAIVSKGKLYKRSTNYEGASAEFQNAIEIDPGYAPAYRELGETEFKMGKLSKAKENYRKYLELSKNNCAARIRYASFLYLSKDYSGALSELNQVEKNCDGGNLTLLRVYSYCYYETKEYVKGLQMVQKLFDKLPESKRASYDYEYYGKLLAASDQDSMGILQMRKAYNIDPNRTDLLSDIANAYYKIKRYEETVKVLQEKAATGKDIKALDYILIGRSYYFMSNFMSADSIFAKLNEVAPTYASGWLWRAQANTHIDSTSELGLAKPHYEKYIEIAQADSLNPAKYNSGLAEAYGYLAYFFILKKDNTNALAYLRLKSALNLEPEDKRNVQQAIDQLEGKKNGK